jgi:ATP-dependent DNA helicase RecG
VGRGEHRSYCLLLAESPSEEARERLSVMERTSDGFELAQKDLEMRGPGEFLGTRQSGFPELPLLNLLDTRTLHEVRSVAEAILEADPELSDEAHRGLAQQVADFWQRKGELS